MKAIIKKTGVEIEVETQNSRVSNDKYFIDKWGNQYKSEDLEMIK